MEKRAAHEKEKYQPSYDTTVLTEVMRRHSGSAEEPGRALWHHLWGWVLAAKGPGRLGGHWA